MWLSEDEEDSDAVMTQGESTENARRLDAELDEAVEEQPNGGEPPQRMEQVQPNGNQPPNLRAIEEVLNGLKEQIRLMQQQNEARDERERAREAQRLEQDEHAARAKDDGAKWKDRALAFKKERDDLRKELETLRNNSGSQMMQIVKDKAPAVQPGGKSNSNTYRAALGQRPNVQPNDGRVVSPTSTRVQAQGARWHTVARGGRGVRRIDLPIVLQERLERTESLMSAFKRQGMSRQGMTALAAGRKPVCLYFSNVNAGNPLRLKRALQELVCPLDREAIMFVCYIGRNVIELLVDEQYKMDTVAALTQEEMEWEENANPLTSFGTKFRSENASNVRMVNAYYLLKRTESLLKIVRHPTALEFYENLNEQARQAIAGTRSNGGDLTDEQLEEIRTKNRKRVTTQEKPGSLSNPEDREPPSARAGANGAPNPSVSTHLGNGQTATVPPPTSDTIIVQ